MYDIWNELKIARTMSIDNETWFIGNDVAYILGYRDPANAITKYVDAEDKRRFKRGTILINMSGLCSLILSSQKENVKKIKKQFIKEILPILNNKILGEIKQ